VYANGKPQASHTTHECQRFPVRDILANMPVVGGRDNYFKEVDYRTTSPAAAHASASNTVHG
jgi:hypothetical protein